MNSYNMEDFGRQKFQTPMNIYKCLCLKMSVDVEILDSCSESRLPTSDFWLVMRTMSCHTFETCPGSDFI